MQHRRNVGGPHVGHRVGLPHHIHVPESPNHGHRPNQPGQLPPLLVLPLRPNVQQVPVPRVVHREHQPEDALPVAPAARDEVRERRRVTRAAADGGGGGEGGAGGAEAGDRGDEEEEGDKGGEEEGEQPFPLCSHADHTALRSMERRRSTIIKNQKKGIESGIGALKEWNLGLEKCKCSWVR